jgi:hypothetical protein
LKVENSETTDGWHVVVAETLFERPKLSLELWLDRFADESLRARVFYGGFYSSDGKAIRRVVDLYPYKKSERKLTITEAISEGQRGKRALTNPLSERQARGPIEEHCKAKAYFFGVYDLESGRSGGSPDVERICAFFIRALRAMPQSRAASLIAEDFGGIEGGLSQNLGTQRTRVITLALKFVEKRKAAGELVCEICRFDPREKIGRLEIEPRALLDMHHKRPLSEGLRKTTIDSFQLLCPNCHRFAHAKLRLGTA